jgi:hypothetical protein
VNKRFQKTRFKFGFEISFGPGAVEQAKEIDKENGNTLWTDLLAEEINSVQIAFRIMNDGEEISPGYQFMECHVIFDIVG